MHHEICGVQVAHNVNSDFAFDWYWCLLWSVWVLGLLYAEHLAVEAPAVQSL